MEGAVDVCFATHADTWPETWEQEQLAEGDEVQVAPDIRISWLTEELRDHVGLGCQPRDFNVGRGPLVLHEGIVRMNASGGTWDRDNAIRTVLALSRLIHPSAHGTDACASLHFDQPDHLQAAFCMAGSMAYRPPGQRPWLTKEEWQLTGELYAAHQALPIVQGPGRRLPSRLHRALWNLSYSAFVEHMHIRWLIVATALEGVIETGLAARQEFLQRVVPISAECGAPVTKKQADRIYSVRSQVAHRGWLNPGGHDDIDDTYMLLDRALAGILRRALTDAGFRGAFETADLLAARWPVAISTPEVM
jgi:hypothetical protein